MDHGRTFDGRFRRQDRLLILTRFLPQISLRNLRKLDCYANRYPLRSKTLWNMRQSISRDAAFLGLLRLIDGPFSERLRPLKRTCSMSPQPASSSTREIVWPSVITVISAAILIGAEVFGAAFAGGWALAILFGLSDTGAHILQAVLFAVGVMI